jgi:hypothetical protein
LITGHADSAIRIWNWRTGKPIRELFGHTRKVVAGAWREADGSVVSASADDQIKLWDAKRKPAVDQLWQDPARVYGVKLLAGTHVLINRESNRDGSFIVDLNGKRVEELPQAVIATRASCSPDGRQVLLGSGKHRGRAYLFDRDQRRFLWKFAPGGGRLGDCFSTWFDSDLAAGSFGPNMVVWRPGTNEIVWQEELADTPRRLFVTPDRKLLLCGSHLESRIFDLASSGKWSGLCDLRRRQALRARRACLRL